LAVPARGSVNSQVHAWLASGEKGHPVTDVAINSLSIADTPRMTGEDSDHVRALAASDADLPPIIVHHPTMRVIDGMHRVRVAKLRGQEKIAAKFFYGDEADAFVLAVKANIAHGLPLSLADKKSAAERIVKSHPQWSDRMIGTVSGLAAKTIAEIRRRNHDGSSPDDGRVGQDGRVRPIDGVSGRLLASELITRNPSLSLRQVAREAGISPETARDVRNRLRNGEAPVPARRDNGRPDRGRVAHREENEGATYHRENERQPSQLRANGGQRCANGNQLHPNHGRTREPEANPAAIMERLKADPALRFTETGRTLLRLLHFHMIEIEEWRKIADNVPPHCSGVVANLARGCSLRWHELAERLEQKLAKTV
jgi:hypothetical protein